ncbi:MAG: MBL fold metallo-hydrolase [Candidatus Diapherotrites archaeon]|uniref:MBL fold metallo-hydrolase n=1 Tax=Candidatus Iainarchaeum sp. TaxID=3101447 RepID=A0A8T5GF31_9ARCH|nr:MBL fold metallo-hydrolase [Candidatus Diapherotrites archaeon]
MDFIVMGSGGAIPTPRPFCQCKACSGARKDPSKRRNSSSLFLKDASLLVDCGEDIASSLNRENIKKVENLFITHWHPDHTYGLRPLLESYFDFRTEKATSTIQLYLPKKVYEQLNEHLNILEHLENNYGVVKVNFIEDGESIEFGSIKVTAVGFNGKDSETFGYLFEENEKRVLYTPCDTISFEREGDFKDLDLLINECGLFEEIGNEILFPDLMARLKNMGPKKTILTHIEEIEVNIFGEEYLQKMKKDYSDINFEFSHDGLKINI